MTRDIDRPIANLSVCPFVSSRGLFYENGLTIVIVFYHQFHQPNHSSFISIKHLQEILTGSPPAGCTKYR